MLDSTASPACPACLAPMEAQLVPLHADPAHSRERYFVTAYRCLRAAEHGHLVPCENDCGELVPNPQFHYSYTDGLLGSGRWSCFPKQQVRAALGRVLDELEAAP